MDDVESRIIELVAKSKNLPVTDVRMDTTFDELQIDSLDKINLSFAVEEMFSIEIPDESLNSLKTVGDVVRGVESLRAERSLGSTASPRGQPLKCEDQVKRVVVTGLGCITPIGNSVEEFRKSLYEGRTGIAPFDPAFPGMAGPENGLRFKTAGKVKNFEPTKNPAQHLTSGVIVSADTSAQFGIIAARQAAAESGLLHHHDPAAIAIITGCACGGRAADEDANRHLYTRNARVPPTAILRTMASSGTSNIAIELGITGPVFNISTACASGNHAIGLAFQMVRAGIAPAAIAGGYEAALTFGFLRAWDSMRVVSPTACRPFSVDRDGMTLGEGAAMLTLESLESAQARGARIYAEIVGFGMSADAHHITQPRAEGAATAIRKALEDAALLSGVESAAWASRRLHQCARHRHAHQRRRRGRGDPPGARRIRAAHSSWGDEIPHRPLDWGCRGDRGAGDDTCARRCQSAAHGWRHPGRSHVDPRYPDWRVATDGCRKRHCAVELAGVRRTERRTPPSFSGLTTMFLPTSYSEASRKALIP